MTPRVVLAVVTALFLGAAPARADDVVSTPPAQSAPAAAATPAVTPAPTSSPPPAATTAPAPVPWPTAASATATPAQTPLPTPAAAPATAAPAATFAPAQAAAGPPATPAAAQTATTTPTPAPTSPPDLECSSPAGVGGTTCQVSSAACTILGTDDDDDLTGSPFDDVICGLGGDDQIAGGGGDDVLDGGDGDDEINGGDGDDTLAGGPGEDCLLGGDGTDTAPDAAPGEQVSTEDDPGRGDQDYVVFGPCGSDDVVAGGGGPIELTPSRAGTNPTSGTPTTPAAAAAREQQLSRTPTSLLVGLVWLAPRVTVRDGVALLPVRCPVGARITLTFRRAEAPPRRLARKTFLCRTTAQTVRIRFNRVARRILGDGPRLQTTVRVEFAGRVLPARVLLLAA
jgi:hemolysin type calcium-binding protein